MIRQGNIYLVDFGESAGSEPGFVRPVVVCPLTSNLRRGEAPGNVLLFPGEGGLREQSVVNVSRILAVNREDLRQKIGTLDENRVREAVAGIDLLLEPRDLQE